tara:strand:+ start:10 stop:474 length:465 start_codon:yes stop_codon:yes gene_type:complete
MIISCNKCNKKFELADNMIPSTGRLLQCGSCSYQWHYIPESKIELVDEVKDNVKTRDQVKKIPQKPIKKRIGKPKKFKNQNIHQSYLEESETKKGKIGFFSFLLAIIISLTSLVILVDTFKVQLSSIIPNIDFYLVSLRDTFRDIFLFFTDLLK